MHVGAIYQPAVLSELRDLVAGRIPEWEVISPDQALLRWLLTPGPLGESDPRWYELLVELQAELIGAQNRGEIVITVAKGLNTIEQLMAGVLPNTRSLVPHAWEWVSPFNLEKNTVWVIGSEWPVVAVEWVETGQRTSLGASTEQSQYSARNWLLSRYQQEKRKLKISDKNLRKECMDKFGITWDVYDATFRSLPEKCRYSVGHHN